jgi:purine-binding chemotaxis protein CheW
VEIDKKKSDRILNEIEKRRLREKTVDIEEEKVKLVIFLLLDDYYAFYGKDIKEILPQKNIFYVPGSPDFITGVINVRGDIESVININKFLGLPYSRITQKSRIAIAVKGDMRSGILLDAVEDVIDVPRSSIKQPLSTFEDSRKDFIAGELFYNNRNITVLDVGKIFGRIKV